MRRRHRRRAQSLLQRDVAEDVARELEFHLAMREQSLCADGAQAIDARVRAEREFGDVRGIAHLCREIAAETERNQKRGELMDGLRGDLRQAWQIMLRRPLLAATVVLVTALAVSGVSAVATLVWSTLLQPLALPAPERVVALHTYDRRFPEHRRGSNAPADVLDFQAQLQSFTALAAINQGQGTILVNDEPERISVMQVGEGMDRVLAVPALHGRMFSSADYAGASGPVLMLTYEYWQRAFNGDPNIVGKSLSFVAGSAQVIGVLPRLPMLARDKAGEIWTPLNILKNPARGGTWLRVVGRLKPDAALQDAQNELSLVSQRLAKDYPQSNSLRSAWIEPLDRYLTYQSGPLLLLLAGAVALLLLTACANVAGLLLASALDRRGEFALRSALGAAPARLGRQVFTETTLLALLGGLLGFLLTPLIVRVFVALYPGGLPRAADVSLGNMVIVLGTLLTGIVALCGAWPLLRQARRLDLSGVLLTIDRGTSTGGGARLRSALVVLQIAFCTVLLVAGVLLLSTYVRVSRTPAGFDASGLVAFNISPPAARYPGAEQYLAFYDALLERIRALPGIRSASYTSLLPFDSDNWTEGMWAEGTAQTPDNANFILYQRVSPEYTRTLGLPLISGRELTDADRQGTPRVVLINTATADKLFPGQNPLGKRLIGASVNLEIVGVVGSKRHRDLSAPPQLEMFTPRRQESVGRALWIVARTDGKPESFLPTLRRVVKEMEPGMAFAHATTVTDRIHQSVASQRFRGFIFGGLSCMALLVSIVGVWSLLVFTVLRRTREIGIRMTLGLEAQKARREVVGSAVTYALAGVVIGEVCAVLLARSLNLVVFGIPGLQPATLLVVAVIFVVIAALAALGPARRVSRIEPIAALRSR